jgi:hypothetical protein
MHTYTYTIYAHMQLQMSHTYYIHTYTHTYMHTYSCLAHARKDRSWWHNTHIHTIHTCIHTIHTYIHTAVSLTQGKIEVGGTHKAVWDTVGLSEHHDMIGDRLVICMRLYICTYTCTYTCMHKAVWGVTFCLSEHHDMIGDRLGMLHVNIYKHTYIHIHTDLGSRSLLW